MTLFACSGSDAGDADPASCVTPGPPGLDDIAMFIGGIEGEFAKEFVELNQKHVWIPPLHDLPREIDKRPDDEEPKPWRGQMRADISLDGAILWHSFLTPPTRSDG